MADRLTLEIATPTRLVVAETVDEIVIPGSQGYFGVLRDAGDKIAAAKS